jgi:hypothetical protein
MPYHNTVLYVCLLMPFSEPNTMLLSFYAFLITQYYVICRMSFNAFLIYTHTGDREEGEGTTEHTDCAGAAPLEGVR